MTEFDLTAVGTAGSMNTCMLGVSLVAAAVLLPVKRMNRQKGAAVKVERCMGDVLDHPKGLILHQANCCMHH